MSGHFEFLKNPLAKEIALILLLKLVLLMGIRWLWFDAAHHTAADSATVGRHLIGLPAQLSEKSLK